MPVPRRRHCKGRRDRRRTHVKLSQPALALCDNKECRAPKAPHRVCPKCGQYRGRTYKTIVTR